MLACSRLPEFLSRRGASARFTEWTFRWVQLNSVRVGASLAAMGLLRNNLETTSPSVCLLKSAASGAYVLANTNEERHLEGTYLFFDREDTSFVRSGKAVGAGRTFLNHFKEHQKNCKQPLSKFYRCYPDKDVPKKESGCRGDFQDLEFYCGLAWSRTRSSKYKALIDPSEEGFTLGMRLLLQQREGLQQRNKN